ncbi:uncharacterized protein [Drosophila takahashii]|uniref:uncharacterized protein n=1 Tax=Drosophila takahashii TaxID=29030 RepID=UPI001CF8C183|nr:uncharacterized protein LOC123003265 [Drosophila takahashii]
MFKFGMYFLYAFVAYNLHGMVESQDNRDLVRDLKDPESMRTLYDHLQQQFNYLGFLLKNEIENIRKESIKKLDEMQKETLSILRGTQANMDKIQQDGICVLTDAPNQCGAFCLAAQGRLFDHNYEVQQQLKELSEKLNETLTKMDSVEKETQSQIETKLDMKSSPGFEKIGSRYFYIENDEIIPSAIRNVLLFMKDVCTTGGVMNSFIPFASQTIPFN